MLTPPLRPILRPPFSKKPFRPPAKQRQYAKAMTIAAGFLCREGVLLCADTEVTGWSLKYHESKLGHFDCPGGEVAFAVAGNTHFGWAAIQKCARKLKQTPPEETLDVIDKTLDREYRRNVLSNPLVASDQSLHYNLLVSLWSPGAGTSLYVTNQTAIRPVYGFECIGAGNELAGYLIRPTFSASMHLREALSLASYALKAAKDSVPGCGGMSIFLIVLNDGRFGTITSVNAGPTKNLEEYSNAYDFSTRELLVSLTNTNTQDDDVERYISEVFSKRVMDVRRQWSADYAKRFAEFAKRNTHLSSEEGKRFFDDIQIGIVPNPIAQPSLQSPKADQLPPQPSQESRGGSDESW